MSGKANPDIFREYDIRGVVERDLLPDVVRDIGRAYGTYLQRPSLWTSSEPWPYGDREAGDSLDVIVGRDNRASSPDLHRWLIEGLSSTGCRVVDIGLAVTPLFYFSRLHYGIEGGVMITGSHNPPEFNGFKLGKGPGTMYGREIKALEEIMESKDFVRARTEGEVVRRDPQEAYLQDITKRVKLGPRKLKVVVDCGNGTAGLFAPRLLRDLGCEVVELYCDSDPSFPNHFPDPVQPDNLRDLIRVVLETGSDVGVSFDGDADRLGAVDERGQILWGDILMALFWREILPKRPGSLAIIEVKCSQALIDEVLRLGGKPLFYRTGHSLIKAKMRETGAVFTGEMSGHMFFADDYHGYDDALYASARLLRILSRSTCPLSTLWSDLPRYASTPEVRVDCPDCEKFSVVEQVRAHFSEDREVIDVDGARVMFPEHEGWALVRASNTQPVLVLRAESKSHEGLESVKTEVERALSKAGVRARVLWGGGK